jgi:uncharacterized coiled-coil DUF342 family protein
MNPVQQKVYALHIALHKRLCRIDDQRKEIKRLRSDLYTTERAITELSTPAYKVEIYKEDIINFRFRIHELVDQIRSKDNDIVKLRQRIHEPENLIRSKDKEHEC